MIKFLRRLALVGLSISLVLIPVRAGGSVRPGPKPVVGKWENNRQPQRFVIVKPHWLDLGTVGHNDHLYRIRHSEANLKRHRVTIQTGPRNLVWRFKLVHHHLVWRRSVLHAVDVIH